jgi:hypothetical protein
MSTAFALFQFRGVVASYIPFKLPDGKKYIRIRAGVIEGAESPPKGMLLEGKDYKEEFVPYDILCPAELLPPGAVSYASVLDFQGRVFWVERSFHKDGGGNSKFAKHFLLADSVKPASK